MLEKIELISEVHVPSTDAKRAAYMKVAPASADDWPALDVAVRHCLSGNLCRCAAYPEVLDAVKLASRKRAARAAVGQ